MPKPPVGYTDTEAAAAIVHIQQLAVRYAVMVDRRDIEGVAALYTPDIECGHWGRGRDAVIKMYHENDSTMGVSIHRVSNHMVDLGDSETATGVVYLVGEHQAHDGTWDRIAGAYHDDYRRVDGEWLIAGRKLLFWYRDGDVGPAQGKRDTDYRLFSKWPTLPEAWPSWGEFWSHHPITGQLHPSVARSRTNTAMVDGGAPPKRP